ncbi:hypothetical protein E2C01_041719 [Portunus trituberculatus]|uniref:Uncharacterized protein n=1 Tax=Portunus trituberculatus TaxID=210409 RepID=A0A5B7FSL9_PORTR|nr:hypothetical protein [Portunus trituberculatus]
MASSKRDPHARNFEPGLATTSPPPIPILAGEGRGQVVVGGPGILHLLSLPHDGWWTSWGLISESRLARHAAPSPLRQPCIRRGRAGSGFAARMTNDKQHGNSYKIK